MGESVKRAGLMLVLAAVVGGCGGSDASEERIMRERDEAADVARQEERVRQLEADLREEGRGRRPAAGDQAPPAPPAPAPTPSAAPAPSTGETSCGNDLSVGPNTTCVFAEAVREEYESSVGSGSGSVTAYSSATDQSYSMSCSDSPHACTGGNNASVYFP